jgi:hypothetical protein
MQPFDVGATSLKIKKYFKARLVYITLALALKPRPVN